MELSEPVRLRVYHGVVLSVDVQLDGQPYGAMLDIGTQTTVVNEGVARALTLDAEDTATLRIGDTDFPGVPVQVEDLEVLRRFDPDGKGFMIVGAAIARDCAISISWIHRELRTCVR
jgi:predicted PhzF superfamily epimerase YddE/YHI9